MKKKYFPILLGLLTNALIQFSVVSESKAKQNSNLEIISDAFIQKGFVQGNYSSQPQCFGTAETASDAYRDNVPIVVICPLTEKEGENRYLTDASESLSAISIVTFVTREFSNAQEKYAVEKAELAANIYARVYHNITSSKMEGVLKDELNKTLNKVGTRDYRSAAGIICHSRKRKLINEVVFETRVCPEPKMIGVNFVL